MTNIAILLGAGESPFASCKSLAHAFKMLPGTEVVTIGPGYGGRFDANILLPDRSHPEWFDVDEVLQALPWSPDLIINVEPHAFIQGQRPDKLPIVLAATDAHCAGSLYAHVLSHGTYTHFINFQPHFAELFRPLPNYIRMLSIPVGFDARRFPQQDYIPSPEVDISFVGHTGITGLEFDQEDEIGPYTERVPHNLPTDTSRYASHGLPSLDYCQRAEMLIRLMGQYRVRIYKSVWGDKYQAALQKGALGFHRSLLNDIAIRCFEIPASGRVLITDCVPQLDTIFRDRLDCEFYGSYFPPFYSNFDLETALISRAVRNYLNNDRLREMVAENGFDLVWRAHQWKHRAQAILEFVLNS